MAKSKSNKSKKSRDPVAENSPRVIKAGVYDGSQASKDFVVSGHSTGSANTEMEALSHQVSRDAGEIPAYETDDSYQMQKSTTNIGAQMPEDFRDTSDLGGPMLYGPNPTLLKNSPLSPQKRNYKKIGLWSSLGLAGAGLLGYAAYKLYNNPELRTSLMPANLKSTLKESIGSRFNFGFDEDSEDSASLTH